MTHLRPPTHRLLGPLASIAALITLCASSTALGQEYNRNLSAAQQPSSIDADIMVAAPQVIILKTTGVYALDATSVNARVWANFALGSRWNLAAGVIPIGITEQRTTNLHPPSPPSDQTSHFRTTIEARLRAKLVLLELRGITLAGAGELSLPAEASGYFGAYIRGINTAARASFLGDFQLGEALRLTLVGGLFADTYTTGTLNEARLNVRLPWLNDRITTCVGGRYNQQWSDGEEATLGYDLGLHMKLSEKSSIWWAWHHDRWIDLHTRRELAVGVKYLL